MEAAYRTLRARARWILAVWLIAWAAFSVPWTSITATPQWERVRAPHVGAESRVRWHHVANVVFYLPAAPLVVALGGPATAGVALGAVMSLTAESLQVFSADRDPDGNDLVANIGGAVAGAVALAIYRRRNPEKWRHLNAPEAIS